MLCKKLIKPLDFDSAPAAFIRSMCDFLLMWPARKFVIDSELNGVRQSKLPSLLLGLRQTLRHSTIHGTLLFRWTETQLKVDRELLIARANERAIEGSSDRASDHLSDRASFPALDRAMKLSSKRTNERSSHRPIERLSDRSVNRWIE